MERNDCGRFAVSIVEEVGDTNRYLPVAATREVIRER